MTKKTIEKEKTFTQEYFETFPIFYSSPAIIVNFFITGIFGIALYDTLSEFIVNPLATLGYISLLFIIFPTAYLGFYIGLVTGRGVYKLLCEGAK